MTKRIFSVFIVALLVISIFGLPVAALEVESDDSSETILFLTSNNSSNHLSCSIKGLRELNVADVTLTDVCNSAYITVNFLDLRSDEELLKYVTDLVDIGKVVYIRASGYSANESLIRDILTPEAKNESEIIETSPEALYARSNTFGYIIYRDSAQHIQVIRQRNESIFLDNDIPESVINGQITVEGQLDFDNIVNSNKIIDMEFAEELDAVDDFLSYLSPTDLSYWYDQNIDLSAQAFDVGSNYEYILDTINYYYGDVRIGAYTRRICASRLYPETSVKTGTPYPAVTSGNTKWAFQAVINMSPNNSGEGVVNCELYTSFTTYPVGTGNLTYKNVITDYLPKTDTSGQTDITYTIGPNFAYSSKDGASGSISGGVSWVESYKDITFTVDYAAGLNTSTNVAAWNYKIGKGGDINADILFPKSIQKTNIELISAVRVDNYGHTRAGVQLNVSPKWGKTTGFLSTTTYSTLSQIAIMLPVR